MEFFCIADNQSGMGFRLGGVNTYIVSTRQETLEALKVARANKQIGVILITDKIAELVPDEIREHIVANPIPLVLEVPSRGSAKKHKSAGELLKELVGIGV